ncbi:hypothetical protein [Xanthomonas phaseoli]|uniref:hypothetical protein n=1 Tax=Xanthomonas phaseoli TaxID=1985254 RepID=UPI001E44332F|nr:hypothetical protein [Xanthomonas phaseoli]MCC8469010.1 hypothetical protein [Xanthomonas phaseoli]
MRQIDLEEVALSLGSLTEEWGRAICQAAAHCMTERSHASGVELCSEGMGSPNFSVNWAPFKDAAKVEATWSDLQVAVEHGAYAIALATIDVEYGLKVVQRSAKGTGFDFWVRDPAKPGILMQGAERVEVSGILSGTKSDVSGRLGEKLKQMNQSSSMGLPGHAVVVEFGRPLVKAAKT